MKKGTIFTLGAIAAGLIASVATKVVVDKKKNIPEDVELEDEERGVAPINPTDDSVDTADSDVDSDAEDTPSLKADAINRPYQPIKY